MNTIDTRDLIEERNDLKEQILNSFLDSFEHYEDQTDSYEDILFEEEEIQDWKEVWEDEIQAIKEIDDLEEEVNSYAGDDFEDGVYLIDEDDFEEYTEEFLKECGYISPDFPSWIEIDWGATANNVKVDYSEVEFRGTTYLYR